MFDDTFSLFSRDILTHDLPVPGFGVRGFCGVRGSYKDGVLEFVVPGVNKESIELTYERQDGSCKFNLDILDGEFKGKHGYVLHRCPEFKSLDAKLESGILTCKLVDIKESVKKVEIF